MLKTVEQSKSNENWLTAWDNTNGDRPIRNLTGKAEQERQSKRDWLKLLLSLNKNRCQGDCAHAQGCAYEEQH